MTTTEPPGPAALIAEVRDGVVGRQSEIEQAAAALATGRHLLVEGPPGTGKSTLLRALAEASGQQFSFVEGNAELTPARLVGAFDPSIVLESGYHEAAFVDGPLLAAMRSGGLLYVEEINRVPEETLNALIGVMSEREIHVPRLGRVSAGDGFRVVAAMNPFDAIGTSRIAGAVYDRCCRLVLGYQSHDDEVRITTARLDGRSLPAEMIDRAVAMVRDTRDHVDLASGSSVRGAIDFALLSSELSTVRSLPVDSAAVTRDAAHLALSGRIRVSHASERSPDDIVDELWARHFAPPDNAPADGNDDGTNGDPPGKG